VERVGDDLGGPHQARLHVLDEKQVDGAEHEAAQSYRQPHLAQVLHEVAVGRIREQPEQGRVNPQDYRDGCPDRHEDDFAPQVVANLDVFLVVMGGMVHLVVALWLKKEVPRLPARHGDQPGQQSGGHWVGEHQKIGTDETHGAQQVQ